MIILQNVFTLMQYFVLSDFAAVRMVGAQMKTFGPRIRTFALLALNTVLFLLPRRYSCSYDPFDWRGGINNKKRGTCPLSWYQPVLGRCCSSVILFPP